MFDKIRNKMFSKREKSLHVGSDSYLSTMAQYRVPAAYTFYKGLSYDNAYPSIKAIANEFMTIRPYAIDANGKPVNQCRLVDALYHPNKEMSAVDFREALAIMALVHRKAYLLVWRREDGVARPGGEITPDNIAGFTFLEGATESVVNGAKTYQCSGHTFSDKEVIEIYSGVDPYDLGRGYSPSVAVMKWANLDDYIAAYEAGLFENNAVPEGQFVITAPTKEAFDEIVDSMERHHKGSGKNNNVQYVHRPISPTTGNPVAPQIEWIPFGVTNKDMRLDTIFKQANDKIDSAFGVPASVRGVNDRNTYASVRIDEQIFIKYSVLPFAKRIYSRITHEMNRITGGLGYALSFDIDVPGVADEEKVEAERKLAEFNLIKQATDAGYSLDSIVDAFKLSNGYKLLKADDRPPVIENDKPEVDEGGEVDDAPDPASLKQVTRVSKLDETGSGGHCCAHHKAASKKPRVVTDIEAVLREQMESQIERAINANGLSKDADDATDEEIGEMVLKILALIATYMLIKGAITYKEGLALLEKNGIAIDATSEYVVSAATRASYQAYLTNVARSYTAETAEQIRRILAKGQTLGWDKEKIATALRGIMDADEWRVQRLARTEEHRSYNQSSVDAMRQLETETGAKIKKIWHTNSTDPCEFCAAMDGRSIGVADTFVPVGGSITGKDGGTFLNNFVDVECADLHPNCHCYITYEIEK